MMQVSIKLRQIKTVQTQSLVAVSHKRHESLSHEVNIVGDLTTPIMRCFNSNEDLVTSHEEAWQELLRQNMRTSERDSVCSCSSQDSNLIQLDDLRSLTVEINEENNECHNLHCRQKCCNHSFNRHRSSTDTSVHRKFSIISEADPPNGESENHTEDCANVSRKTSRTESPVVSNGFRNRCSSVYIQYPLQFNQSMFVKVYKDYIEKSKTKSAISPSDINEIFQPLRTLPSNVEDNNKNVSLEYTSSTQPLERAEKTDKLATFGRQTKRGCDGQSLR